MTSSLVAMPEIILLFIIIALIIKYTDTFFWTFTKQSEKKVFISPLPTHVAAATAAKSLQSCPTLCDPTDGSPPGSPVPGILQARTLEWVAISFSNAWKCEVKVKSLSCV